MTDSGPQAPREFNYAAFIEALVPLVEQAKAFQAADRRHDGEAFRAWRHKVEDMLVKINRTHMDVNCDLDHRRFRVLSYDSISAKDQQNAFDRDMRDTLVELDHLIDWYAKYGEPKQLPGTFKQPVKTESAVAVDAPMPPSKPKEPEWPQKEKLTLHWLFTNMPASAWLWLAFVVGGAFTLGVTVGSWLPVQKKVDRLSEPAATLTIPAPPASAAPK